MAAAGRDYVEKGEPAFWAWILMKLRRPILRSFVNLAAEPRHRGKNLEFEGKGTA